VSFASPTEILPARQSAVRVVPPLAVLDTLQLSPRHRVCVVADGAGTRFVVPMVEGDRGWRRARADDGAAEALVALLRHPTRAGLGAFEITSWSVADVEGERAIEVDQSNESVVVGEQAVVKWSLRADDSPAPDRLITLQRSGFRPMPAPWGLLRWRASEGSAAELLASVVAFLPGAVDGWEWAVADARSYAAGSLDKESVAAVATTVGTHVAALHVALAADGVSPATAAQAAGWAADARAELEQAVTAMDGAEGERLAGSSAHIAPVLAELGRSARTPTMAVHGDLHVGQILRHGTPPRYAITDFDGNPLLAAAQRRAPQPAAVDVAGLLQSIDHVARVVVHHHVDVDAGRVQQWADIGQQAFLTAYQATLAGSGAGHLLDESLLRPLRLRQVCREYLYAARHLPHWRYVPDAALPALLGAG
jgi:maltokinase